MPQRRFEEIMEEFAREQAEVAHALRDLIVDRLPEAKEDVYGGAKVTTILYSLNGPVDVVCGLGPTKDGCLLYLHRVEQADSPSYKLEGKGKHCRHIRFTAVGQIDEVEINRLVKLAETRLLDEKAVS